MTQVGLGLIQKLQNLLRVTKHRILQRSKTAHVLAHRRSGLFLSYRICTMAAKKTRGKQTKYWLFLTAMIHRRSCMLTHIEIIVTFWIPWPWNMAAVITTELLTVTPYKINLQVWIHINKISRIDSEKKWFFFQY